MNIDAFWQIIDAVHDESAGDMDQKCDLLKGRLMDLTESDLRDFIRHFDAAESRAYAWPLWGAAYVMHGGCSDDAFSDFRATLISHGRKVFEAALDDPESLIHLNYEDEEDICYEGFQYVMNDVAEARLGEIPQRETPFASEPSGEEWDEESVYDLYPKLAARYAGTDESGASGTPKKPWWKFW